MSARKPSSQLAAIVAAAQSNVEGIRQNEGERRAARQLPIGQISPSPYQARRDFSNLASLVEDIREHGVLQPILVRPLGEDRFELIAGERRWRASQEAGLTKIPAVVREFTDREALLVGLAENLQREDLNAYEIARAVIELAAAELEQPADQVRKALSSKRPEEEVLRAMDAALGLLNKDMTLRTYQRHYLPLLRLDPHLIEAIEHGASYAAVLLIRGVEKRQQQQWLPKLVSGEWSRSDLEEALRKHRSAAKAKPVPHEEYDWGSKAQEVQQGLTEERLRQLDGRQQRKARRLLEQLAELLGESTVR